MIRKMYKPEMDHEGKWMPVGPGGLWLGNHDPELPHFATEEEAQTICNMMNLAFHEGSEARKQTVKKAIFE